MASPRNLMGALAVLSMAAAISAPGDASAQTAAGPVTPEQAAALGKQAFLYGVPLLEFLRARQTFTSVRCPDDKGNAPLNSFSTATHFLSPSVRTVVAPNVDTLYSVAELDLGKGPVVLSHPRMRDRYFVFQLLDPYTNTVGYVGSRTTGSAAGRFAITWTGHPGKRVPGARVLKVEYRRIWVIGRTLAGNHADQAAAVRLMRRYTLAPPGGPRHFAPGCRPGRPTKARTPAGRAFLDRLAVALHSNPPPARDQSQLEALATVGVGPGLHPEKAGLTPEALRALYAGVESNGRTFADAIRASIIDNAAAHSGWAFPPWVIGDFGVDYITRAGTALIGLGANTPAEATYPTAYTDGEGRLLNGRHDYRLVFTKAGRPPARAFWSLTMYDGDGYLVANPQRRYSIGNSHPGLDKRADGRIVVALQRTRPTNPGMNWLPTPKGRFRLNLRLYWPRASVLGGRWAPPPIKRLER